VTYLRFSRSVESLPYLESFPFMETTPRGVDVVFSVNGTCHTSSCYIEIRR
jgi:hypothetical protein